MIINQSLIVRTEEEGLRLDALLGVRYPSSTRAFCREAISSGKVTIRGAHAVKGRKMHSGEEVVVHELREACDNRIAPDPSVKPSIVYDDGGLIGVDKPAGIPVQPLSCTEKGTLMNGLVAYAPELAGIGDDPMMAGALHRIDTGTSGLVLAARSNELFTLMRGLFAARLVKKTYLALVSGHVAAGGTISCDLAHDPDFPICRMVKASSLCGPVRPMHAETTYRPLRLMDGRTLLEVTIRTGVTHQIRAQLAMAGLPIVGDDLYGAGSRKGSKRHCLHALAVSFVHPITSVPLKITTPWPSWAKGAGEA